jgi:hypothetical protein
LVHLEEDSSDGGTESAFLAVLGGPAVRSRVLEYLGAQPGGAPTCVHLALGDAENPARLVKYPLGALDRLLAEGSPIARSLFDTASMLVHLDVEYVNFDAPAASFTDPWHAFAVQEPVVTAVEELLAAWGIRPLHLLTGQGHHFVWRLPRDSPEERRLAHLVPAADRDGSEQGFANLALVMEYLAHRVKARARDACPVPVEITAVQTPPGPSGQREAVSVDISEYGDPLDARTIRVPFTRYLKPWRSGLARRLGVEDQIGPCVTIPLHEMDTLVALKARQDPGDVERLARRCCTRIPSQAAGMNRLIDDYLASPLRDFHARFYETAHDPPERWAETYGHTPLHELPACLRHVLTWPNDALLKPSALRLVTRVLLGQGWHPRHIAGLVRSKFEDSSFQWGDAWRDYSPGFRADFYVRLFAGQIATGLDRLEDLDCDAHRLEGLCFQGAPPCDLAPFRHATAALFPKDLAVPTLP